MIKQVSWAEYFSVLAVLIAVYYVIIVLLYYRYEVWQILSGNKKLIAINKSISTDDPPSLMGTSDADIETQAPDERKLFSMTNELMQNLQPVFDEQYTRSELMMALHVELRKYPSLIDTAFQVSVNNYIQKESEIKCSVSLSEQELRGIWKG